MRRPRRTSLITIFCLAVLGGIGISRKYNPDLTVYWFLALPLLVSLKYKNFTSIFTVLAFGLVIGLGRGNTYMQNVYQLNSLNGQKLNLQVKATTDAVYSKKSQIEFISSDASLSSGQALAGNFKISGFGEPMVYRGDIVSVTGKFYTMRGSNQGRMSYAQIQRLGTSQNLINDFTRKFDAGMQNALPEPQASFALGLLIGQRTTLPKDITAQLVAVGLVHIVAVSGYNLTILVRGIGRVKLGSKYQKLIASLTLIIGFVLITGFSASIVRAAIVSILGLWAWYYGRQIKPLVLISFAAALTGLWNPYYVWSDLGWYLSFLAFFGVLVIAPLIAARFFQSQPKLLTMVLLETLSAEIMTLPLILMTFSQLSLVALLANVLVVPLVPPAMLLSALAGLAGAFLPAVAGWVALPARLVLTYMLDVIHVLSTIPSVLLHRSISLITMLIFYACVILFVLSIYKFVRKTKRAVIDPGAR
jgi:competence protein ComEC